MKLNNQPLRLIFCIFISLSCNGNNSQNSVKEIELLKRENAILKKENELKLATNDKKNLEDSFKKIRKLNSFNSGTKYVYAYFIVKEPKLDLIEGAYKGNYPGTQIEIPYIKYRIIYENYVYTSDIKAIENYTEDKKYMFLEKAKDETKTKIWSDGFYFDASLPGDARLYKGYRGEIITKKVYVFNSFKEAINDKDKR